MTAEVQQPMCATCPHFVHTDVRQGECRAEPPKGFPVFGPSGFQGGVGIFPPTKADGWCSHHPERQRKLNSTLAKVVAFGGERDA